MRNHPTLSVVPTAPTTPCPHWCIDHTAQQHYGAIHLHLDADAQNPQELWVRLAVLVEPDEPETLYVTVASRVVGDEHWDALDPDLPLSPAGAAWLGATLSRVAAEAIPTQRSSEPPQIFPTPLDRWSQGAGTFVCVSCGSEVRPDSTPSLDLCWMCAELRDIETVGDAR